MTIFIETGNISGPSRPDTASIVSIDLKTFRETRIPVRDQPGVRGRFGWTVNLFVTPK